MSVVHRAAVVLGCAVLLLALGLVVVQQPTASGAAPGSVTGVVTRASGQPLANSEVGIWDPEEELYEDFVDTSSAGRFTFSSVPPGDYLLHVYGTETEPGMFWPNVPTEHTATLVHVGSGAEVTADFTLVEGATIAGTPRSWRGRPVRQTDVVMYLRYGACARCWEWVSDSVGSYGSDRYVARNLPPGTYRISFRHQDYLPRYYRNATTFAAATPVTVEAGETRTRIDVVLRKGRFDLGRRATVGGTPKVGRTLTANPPTSRPRAAVAYRWLRAGQPIRGATQRTYGLRPADRGKRVSVRITLRRDGYLTVVRTVRVPGVVRPR